MAKFKVGDKVRVLGDYYVLGKKERIGTIIEINIPRIWHGEYIVSLEKYDSSLSFRASEIELIEAKPSKSERISLLESQVAELTAKVEALEKRRKPAVALTQAPTIHNVTVNLDSAKSAVDIGKKITEAFVKGLHWDGIPKPKPNLVRKAVIERAKAFVLDVSEKAEGDESNDIGNVIYRHRTTRPEFHVNEKKRTVTVLLKGAHNPFLIGKAIAKCAPDDVFNADIGKAIAIGRALGLDVTEFENAVKPTEVVVGQYVDSLTFPGFAEQVVSVASGKVYVEDEDYWRVASLNKAYRIADDTNAEYV